MLKKKHHEVYTERISVIRIKVIRNINLYDKNQIAQKTIEIPSFLRFWSHLLKKSLMENFIFDAVFRLSRQDLSSDPSVSDKAGHYRSLMSFYIIF